MHILDETIELLTRNPVHCTNSNLMQSLEEVLGDGNGLAKLSGGYVSCHLEGSLDMSGQEWRSSVSV